MEEGETAQKQLLGNYPEELIKNAKSTAYFGGEFDFDKMNFFQKMIVKKVAGVDHSTSKVDYEAVQKFSKKMDRVFNPFLFLV
jgi:menaquinone-dependent protoporphyrinogen oxidase